MNTPRTLIGWSARALRESQSLGRACCRPPCSTYNGALGIIALRRQSSRVQRLRGKYASKYPTPSDKDAQASRAQASYINLDTVRRTIKQHPYQSGLAIGIICVCSASFIVIVGFEIWASIYAPHNYPEEVAKALRKAVYFTKMKPDHARALRFYKEAIFAAQEAGLSSISSEVVGIKLQLGKYFEGTAYAVDNAIVVYEGVYNDCIRWLIAEGDQHLADGHRTRVLEFAVRTAVKLGELYGLPQVKRFEDSEQILATATETVLKERQRRNDKDSVKDDRNFLSDDEVGAAMERLASAYHKRSKPHLAAPLYLHAISLAPRDSCHTVVLMNNLASAIAEQSLPESQLQSGIPSPTAQAELWARQALTWADKIPAVNRNAECVTGCATAKANIAELIERQGRLAEALQLYQEAEKESESAGFRQGVKVAGDGRVRVLQALKAKAP